MTKQNVYDAINKLLHEKLFSAIKKIIIEKRKDRLMFSSEYQNSSAEEKKHLLQLHYRNWFESISTFYLDLHSIYAIHPLVERELQIKNFTSEDVIRVKVDYCYDEIDFSVYFPTRFTADMQKEIEDCIAYLKDEKHEHIVSLYAPNKDSERAPHEPMTLSKLKYDCFYVYGFDLEYSTRLSRLLYEANLITNPETNGWEIDDNIVEDIIILLNSKFSENMVLQHKRSFQDNLTDRTLQECIRPTNVTQHYFPKYIRSTVEFNSIKFTAENEAYDAERMYEFIFYITIATQLKNSIYDTSSIEIEVGGKKLKAQSHLLIKGQENWELIAGKYIKRLDSSSGIYSFNTNVLPEVPPEEKLQPKSVYAFSYPKQRPPRYGVGRFLVQILNKHGIGSINLHDSILKNLLESKALLKIKDMLHPQESSLICIEWIAEHAPLLLDLEYLNELEEKADDVINQNITLDSLLNEIDRLIETSFESSGFVMDDKKPSQAKINLVRSIAKKNNLFLDPSIFESSNKIDMIIAQYPQEELIKIGSCPSCNAVVYQKEYFNARTEESTFYFACENFSKKENVGCKFSMWDSYIYKYFSDKAIEFFTVEERADALKKILSKRKGYLFNGFIAKNQKPYDAKVSINSYIDRKDSKEKWCFELTFVNKKNR